MTAIGKRRNDDSTRTAVTGDGGAAPEALPLTRVGRYTIEGILGAGGMAVVYIARDPALDRRVALKVIRADGDAHAASRLVREGQALARVSHPNVIHVYEVGREADQLVFIAMERIDGVTLDEWLAGARPRRAILAAFADAGRGLAAAHAAGLVHRDFKPHNVMIGRDGRVRVLDFGLAHACEADDTDDAGGASQHRDRGAVLGITAIGSVVGTPAYMSPEQWRGQRATARSDQFSFCVSLACALAGEHPFASDSRDELRAAVTAGRMRKLPSTIPRRLRAVLRRGMALDPADRYPSIDAIVDAIAVRPRRWLAAGVLAVAGASVAAALVLQSTDEPATTRAYAAPRAITSRGDIGIAAVSPDGAQLAFLTRDALVVRPTHAGADSRVLLRGRPAHHWLAWSPDSTTLALVTSLADDSQPPGLVLVDVPTGAARRISDNLGMVALLDDDELAAARFAGTHVTFYSTRDARRPLRTCALPQPFTGVRSLRHEPARGTVLVQLDRSDSESVVVRVDRTCHHEPVTAAIRALSFVRRSDDGRLLARMLSGNDLVELGTDGRPTTARHVLQSSDYEPLAASADTIVHLDRAVRWGLVAVAPDGRHTDLARGTLESRFAIAPDHTTIAHVDGVYRRGLLRIGRLEDIGPDAPSIHTGVSRVAWSPDGTRLAVLSNRRHGYEVAVWDRATRRFSPPRPVAIRYDVDMSWIDDHRVAFAVAHEYRGFLWVDPATGASGTLAVGDGEATFSLARAHGDDRLAFVTETATEIRAWAFRDGERPHLVAAVPVTSSRSSRRARVVWSADDRALLVYDGASGELWSVALADGSIERMPDLPLPRAGSFAEATNVFVLPDRLVVETLTRSADVYVSEPLD